MEHRGQSVLFLGDLDDPWIADMIRCQPLPISTRQLGADWPEFWPRPARDANIVVVHRSILTASDGEAFLSLKSRLSAKLILIVGPHVRAADLERWAGSADVILPEATASETLARHLGVRLRVPTNSSPVAVVSSLFETRRWIVECCETAGHAAFAHDGWTDVPKSVLTVWDVPLLDHEWDEILARESRSRRLICLMGFADRALISRARRVGASACLDLPFEPADLSFVLDRVASRPGSDLGFDPGHEVPPAPRLARPILLPLVAHRRPS